MMRRRPLSPRYRLLDHYLVEVVPQAQLTVSLSFAEITALLRGPLAESTAVSALTLEQRFDRPLARQHWQRVGFTVRIDWIARQVVFTRRGAAAP